ncbi:MAG: hypothetical protein ACRDTC_07175 [Pseudonocardiaceae bacterium]
MNIKRPWIVVGATLAIAGFGTAVATAADDTDNTTDLALNDFRPASVSQSVGDNADDRGTALADSSPESADSPAESPFDSANSATDSPNNSPAGSAGSAGSSGSADSSD